MTLLDEFDSKIETATKQLDSLLQDSGRIKTVNDLLEQQGARHAETNQALITVYNSLADLSGSLNSAISTLNATAEIVKSADPSKVVNLVDNHNQKIKSEINALNAKYAMLVDWLEAQDELFKSLSNTVSEYKKTTVELVAQVKDELIQHAETTSNRLISKTSNVLVLVVINLLAIGAVVGLLGYGTVL